MFDNGGDIFTARIDGSHRVDLTPTTADIFSGPDWSPNGKFITFEDDTSGQILRIAPTGGSTTVVTPVGCAPANPCQDPSVSPDSKHVAFDREGTSLEGIFQVLADGTSAFLFQLANRNDDFASYAPQGNRVAYQDGNGLLSTVATDGSGFELSLGTSAGHVSWGVVPRRRRH